MLSDEHNGNWIVTREGLRPIDVQISRLKGAQGAVLPWSVTQERLRTAGLETASETPAGTAPLGADPEVTARAARIQNDLTNAGVPVAPAPRTLRFSQPGKGTGKTSFTAIKPGDSFDNISQLRPENRAEDETPPKVLVRNPNIAVKLMLQTSPVIKDNDGINILLANPDFKVTGVSERDPLEARARHLTGIKQGDGQRAFDATKAMWAKAIPVTISDYDLKLAQGSDTIYLRWYGSQRHMVVVGEFSRRAAGPYVKEHGSIDWGLKSQRRLGGKLPGAQVLSVRKLAGAGISATDLQPPLSADTPAATRIHDLSAESGTQTETHAPSTSLPYKRKNKPSLPTGKPKSTGIPPESAQRAVSHLRDLDPDLAANTRILPNREALPLEEIDAIGDADWDHMASAEGYFDESTGQTTLFNDNVARRPEAPPPPPSASSSMNVSAMPVSTSSARPIPPSPPVGPPSSAPSLPITPSGSRCRSTTPTSPETAPSSTS